MSIKVKSIFLGILVLVGTAFLSGCTGKDRSQLNVFKIPLKDDVKTLDPVNVYDSVSTDVIQQIIEAPLQYKYLESKPTLEPLVAESMPEYSKDGLTVTLKLKKGIHFQDDPCFKDNGGKGRELKAQDFIYGFKRHAIPAIQSQGAWIFEGKIVGFDAFEKRMKEAKKEELAKVMESPVEGFTAKDDYTIEFKLTQPYPILNYILAMQFATPVAPECAAMYADADGNLRDHPVGTGPFMLKSWETNQKVVLVKNPNFRRTYPTEASEDLKAKGFLADAGKPIPFVDELDFYVVKEDMPRFLLFQKGDLDRIELTKDTFEAGMLDATHVKPELATKGVLYTDEDSLVDWYLGFNMNDKLLQNKYLRQAIALSIDREKYNNTFFQFHSSVQTQVAPPQLADTLPQSTIKYGYNVPKAKELLAKAGYPEGKGLPTLNLDLRGPDTKYRQMGEFFVEQLGAIGIKVNVILNTFPAYLEKSKQNNLQVFLGGWNYDYPDAENGLQLLYGPNKSPGPNDTNFQNAQYDALYKKMAVLPAGAPGRSALIKEMEAIVQEESPWVYLTFERLYNLYHSRVKNYRTAEVIPNKYKYVRIEQDKK